MTWRPATQEPDLLDEALAKAIRATILPHVALGPPPGDRPIDLEDGRRVRLDLTARAVRRDVRDERSVVVYEIAGFVAVQAANEVGTTRWLAFELEGSANIDVATQAFFSVEHRLTAVGHVVR